MSSDILAQLDDMNTVAIITTRRDGSRIATPIWSVVVDGVAYLRSVDGPEAAWYRRAVSGRPVAFSLADGHLAERDSTAVLAEPSVVVALAVVPTDDPVQSAALHNAIDSALTAKYSSEPTSLAPMLRAPATNCTLMVNTA